MLTGIMTKAQENKVKIKLSGFVATEANFDTRKNVTSRDGVILLYPANKSLDANGDDVNANSSFSMNAIQSRMRATVSGFNAFGAAGTAVLEGDFAGISTDKTSLFRLRHAFIKLDWKKDQLIAGKTWHPFFVPSAFPRVIHFGATIPIEGFCRAPQLRYTRKIGDKTSLSFVALSEMDFKTNGPNGASVEYVQQAGVPELSVLFKTMLTNNVEYGAVAGYKTIKPLTVNIAGLQTDETLGTYYAKTWLGLTTNKFKWNVQAMYGQNMTSLVMLGGYGVKNVKANGDYEYTSIATTSFTSDIYTTTGSVRYGLNIGYSKNLGAQDDLAMKDGKFVGLYSRGSDIDYLYQASPRVELRSGKMMLVAEAVYTAAAYGNTQVDGTVDDSDIVDSTRLVLHLRYSF
jgi:hypothetical protein